MKATSSVERHLFFEGILLKYGYDFRQYAEASMDRRIARLQSNFQVESLIDLLKLVLDSPEVFKKVVAQLTINTTEFFRDPKFFKSLREHVFPLLHTYPKVNIWSAGCSTGEEVLSLAIALREEGLDKRSTIYATDINSTVLTTAKQGIYHSQLIPLFNRNYSLAGGTRSPSDYYTAEYGLVRFDPELLSKVAFSEHNLATDAAFVEAHLILCRNVPIYFSKELQERSLNLFSKSLVHKGFLGLGPKENVQFSEISPLLSKIPETLNLFTLHSRSLAQSGAAHFGGR